MEPTDRCDDDISYGENALHPDDGAVLCTQNSGLESNQTIDNSDSDPYEYLTRHSLLALLLGIAFWGSTYIVHTWIVPLGPIGVIAVASTAMTLILGLWFAFIELPRDERQETEYPKSYTRAQAYHDYHIEIEVTEWQGSQNHPHDLQRSVEATAFDDDGDIVASERSTASAGRFPQTIFDAKIEADGNGVSAGDQTHRVLERLHEDILTHEATGSIDETAGVDAACDVVFGGER